MSIFSHAYNRARDARLAWQTARPVFTSCCGLLLALTLASCQNGSAISPPSADAHYQIITLDSSTMPSKKPNAILHNFNYTAPLQDYRLGPADTLDIRVLIIDSSGKEGLLQVIPPRVNGQHAGYTISNRGLINLPLTGNIAVGGLSIQGARDIISQHLRRYFIAPQLDISVKNYASQQIFISGEVKDPGTVPLTSRPLYILGALQKSGNVLASANLPYSILTHPSGKRECINLHSLLFEGDSSQNKQLFGGDVLHIPRHHSNQIFILGEVNRPGTKTIEGQMTLLEAFGSAKDLDRITANKSNIYVLRNRIANSCELTLAGHPAQRISAKTTIYKLDIKRPEKILLADQFNLQPRDVIYVAARPVTQWQRFISQLIPSSISTLADRNRFEE